MAFDIKTTQDLVKILLDNPPPAPAVSEVGRVAEVADGIAIVTGLARALSDEMLDFASGVQGIVFDLEPGRLGVVLLGPSENVTMGEDVRRTGRVVSVPVGPALLGRVVDGLGRPRDGLGPVETVTHTPIEAEAPISCIGARYPARSRPGSRRLMLPCRWDWASVS